MNTISAQTVERIKAAHERVKYVKDTATAFRNYPADKRLALYEEKTRYAHIVLSFPREVIADLLLKEHAVAMTELEAANRQAAAELLGTA